jgi:predicted lipoprotein with Yx(FWY)xxD motif
MAAALVALLTMMAAPAVALEAQSALAVDIGGNEELGEFLVGGDGMTLYIFTPDEPGVSNCNGGCATAWPPLTVPDGTEPTAGSGVSGELTLITRDDGSQQVALDGQPLYFWQNDSQPGDATGQGVNEVWYVLDAAGVPITSAPAPATPPAAGSAGNAGLLSNGGTSALGMALLVGSAIALVFVARVGALRR